MQQIVVVYDDAGEALLEKLKTYDGAAQVRYVPVSELYGIDVAEEPHLVGCGETETVRTLFAFASEHNLSLGIVALPSQEVLRRTFALPENIDDAAKIAMQPAGRAIDVLRCGNETVLFEAVIGKVPPLDRYETAAMQKVAKRAGLLLETFRAVRTLRHRRYKLTDESGKQVDVSASGMVALKYRNMTFASKLAGRFVHASDGLATLAILAPRSVVEYVGYLTRTLLPKETTRLPVSVGVMRFSRLEVACEEAMDVAIDGAVRMQTPVTFRVEKEALRLSVGEAFWKRQNDATAGKKSEKLAHLPRDEESANVLRKALPLLTHASQEAYAALLPTLREEARLSSTFSVLLVLATLIAALGLFINSASVIIGAMLLAPLMQPIVSLSMGVLRMDGALARKAFGTVTVGVAMVLAASALLTWALPLHHITSEMQSRLSPTLLDLFVALVSGAAAAYAKSNEKIAGSLAGVAIAVALVPPIAVAGIGAGWGEWEMFTSAFLLFLTNLAGIVFAAAVTFTLLGYAPFHLAKKSVAGWLAVVVLVAFPLSKAFMTMTHRSELVESLERSEFRLKEHTVKLEHVTVVPKEGVWQVRCDAISDGVLSKEEKRQLKAAIEQRAGEKLEPVVTMRYKL